jgi:hypothetical protein
MFMHRRASGEHPKLPPTDRSPKEPALELRSRPLRIQAANVLPGWQAREVTPGRG